MRRQSNLSEVMQLLNQIEEKYLASQCNLADFAEWSTC
jgi:hypothetical protein